MQSPFNIGDVFLYICNYLDWRDLSTMRISSKFHRDLITKNAGNLVTSIRKKNNTKKKFITGKKIICLDEANNNNCEIHNTENCNKLYRIDHLVNCHCEISKIIRSKNYFGSCYSIDLSGLEKFHWSWLLHFDNKMHYLSLNGTNLALDAVIQNYLAPHDILEKMNTSTHSRTKIWEFMNDNFNENEIQMFFCYEMLHDWFHIEEDKRYYWYELDEVPENENYVIPLESEYYVITLESLEYIDSDVCNIYVKMIANDIKNIKNTLEHYARLKQWFSDAEIDIIDLYETDVPSCLLECLKQCKKVIIGQGQTYGAVIKFLRDHGVELMIKDVSGSVMKNRSKWILS